MGCAAGFEGPARIAGAGPQTAAAARPDRIFMSIPEHGGDGPSLTAAPLPVSFRANSAGGA